MDTDSTQYLNLGPTHYEASLNINLGQKIGTILENK
jgi:hypothetical protein